jgi:hypothetical protein
VVLRPSWNPLLSQQLFSQFGTTAVLAIRFVREYAWQWPWSGQINHEQMTWERPS